MKKLPRLFLWTVLFSTSIAKAQVITNQAVLEKASKLQATQETQFRQILLARAKQKGWPLTLTNKNGRHAYLRGINSKGNPVYISTTDNLISAATIGTNQLWPGGSTGLNLNGSSSNMNTRLAVWDEGKVRSTHVELVNRVTQKDAATSLSDHSTHVAGTMIATGINPVAKGMAFAAKLNAYDFDSDESEMMSAAAAGLLVSNHSYAIIAGWYYNSSLGRWEWYGNYKDSVDVNFGLYDKDTQIWDSIAYNAPNYLIAKAAGNNRSVNGPAVGASYYGYNASNQMTQMTRKAGAISNNDGYEIIATYGNAKNILTVGAVNPIPGGYLQPSDVVMTDFSSWGPTGDGRIKPDVVADGYNVLSSISTSDNAYDIFSGTSMATPASAGSAFLLQEYYSKLHGASSFLRAATLKGLLIHTADEAGPSPGPDYKFGWGLIDMKKAASVITSDNSSAKDQQILENTLTNTTHDADSITVIASGTQSLVATISWTDPAATPVASSSITTNFQDTARKLINDLDLRIFDVASNTTYYPWILDPKNRGNAATQGDNIRDNVEKVQVDSLIAGKTYKIRISHKGSLARGSQAYSLLISGVGGKAYCSSASTGVAGSYINKVNLAGINNSNSSGCKSYSDFTGTTAATLPLGQTVNAAVSYQACSGSGSALRIAIYIDLNNDGDFDDAGELVAQSAALTSTTSSQTWNTSFSVPTSVSAGASSRMRIVAQDGAASAPAACGTYTSGETQDYRVIFAPSSTDVGVSGLTYPVATSCSSDSQTVTVRIRNYGTTAQTNIPVSTVITNGGTTIASLSATCKDSIAGKSEVAFTYNTTFKATAGATYTFTSTTALSNDANSNNNQDVSSVTISAGSSPASGTATICGANATSAALQASASGSDIPLWYDSQTATIPIAAGASTTTTVIPSDKTYYLGLNDLNTRLGPPNKISGYTGGAGLYFRYGGNFVQLSTSVPLTIQSARMYVAHNGTVTFTLATLASRTTTGYSYIPLYTTTIDVYPTKQTPVDAAQVAVSAGDNTDTGAIFNLNIPIPTPGDYIVIIDCSDHTSIFMNYFGNASGTVPYPISIPGVISITGDDMYDAGKADSATYFKKFYYPWYDVAIRLDACPSTARTPVVASTATAPTISLNGNVLTSNVATGNQWYRNGSPMQDSTAQSIIAIYSGTYTTVVADPVTGCSLTSNAINFTSTGTTDVNGSAIGLKVTPNPNNGIFQLQFNFDTPDNTSVSVLNTVGQKVYEAAYPNLAGQYSEQISLGSLASGMYILKIVHGNNTYIKKILVKK